VPDQPTSLTDRIEQAFDDDEARAYGDKFLDYLVSRYDALEQALRRTSVLCAVLVVSFLLLAGAKQAKFTVGPITLTNVAGVLTLIPAVFSYLYYELVVLVQGRNTFAEGVSASVAKLYPTLDKNGLVPMLAPATVQAWSPPSWQDLRAREATWGDRFDGLLETAIIAIVLFGSVLFVGYCYWHLYREPKANTIAVSASIVFSALNVTRSWLVGLSYS
jgi:hypothetical protein